ncbi:MATE family efflux transporter, partial [Halalkalibacter lacteus]|uniref:MATE family efflux transporter n=1 Tax=Halalkalibacter lacteus TaxID=3090663 RepID=UPI002FCB2329
VVVSGVGAAQRLVILIMLPSLTLVSAVNSMAGQNIGAKLWGRVDEIAKQARLLITLVSVTISTIIFFGADFFIIMFLKDE